MEDIYYKEGQFTKEQFNEYIKGHMSNKQYKILDSLWSSLDNEDDEFIEYKSITTSNENGHTYNELLLLDVNDINNKYMPVYIENINTSSLYALMRLYTDFEDDEDKYMSINDFKDLLMTNYDVSKICGLLRL